MVSPDTCSGGDSGNSFKLGVVVFKQLKALTGRSSLRKSIAAQRSQFEQLTPSPGQFVFLGDSNIEQGAWNEWFPTLPCINRGIGGDTVSGVRLRLDSAINQPLGVSLVIGSNDVAGFRGSRKVPEVADELHKLITDIKSSAPSTALFLNSVLPRSPGMSGAIRSLNERYRDVAITTGTTYVDAWSALSATDGSVRPEFTFDGHHLNGLGYRRWVDVLRPHVESLC
jgi:lysophospholipase L1-like esterase